MADRVAKHEQGCKALVNLNSKEKKIPKENTTHQQKLLTNNLDNPKQTPLVKKNDVGSRNKLVPCKKCGRKYMADRVTKHEQGCKAIVNLNSKEKKTPKTPKNTQEQQSLTSKVNSSKVNRQKTNRKRQGSRYLSSKNTAPSLEKAEQQYIKKSKNRKTHRKKSEAFKEKEKTLKIKLNEKFIKKFVRCSLCGQKFNRSGINTHARKCKATSPPIVYEKSKSDVTSNPSKKKEAIKK